MFGSFVVLVWASFWVLAEAGTSEAVLAATSGEAGACLWTLAVLVVILAEVGTDLWPLTASARSPGGWRVSGAG